MSRRKGWIRSGTSWQSLLLLIFIGAVFVYPAQAAIVVIVAFVCGCSFYALRLAERRQDKLRQQAQELKRRQEISLARLDIIDSMSGPDFEELVAGLLDIMGYRTQVTQRSRDGGADVIAEKGGERIAVQTKRYSQSVGISAVQEVTSSMFRYQCQKCMVITNSTFTRDAIEQAAHSPCVLVDREGLVDIIAKARRILEEA